MTGNVDFPSCWRLAGKPGNRLLLLCDHASNALPPAYGTLELLASFVGSEQLLPVSAV